MANLFVLYNYPKWNSGDIHLPATGDSAIGNYFHLTWDDTVSHFKPDTARVLLIIADTSKYSKAGHNLIWMRGYQVSKPFTAQSEYLLPNGYGKYIRLPESWLVVQVVVLKYIH